MAAPTFVAASTGTTDASGAWAHTCMAPGAAGRLILVHILSDGTNPTVASVVGTNITNIAGTSNVWTQMSGTAPSGWQVGAPSAYHFVFAGRSTGTTAPTISGANSGGDDLYIRAYEFNNANTSTTLGEVFENGGVDMVSGDPLLGVQGTGTTVSDCGVTTNGEDRLACNFVGVNLNTSIAAFTGMTGGTWVEAVAEFSTTTGTDAALQLQTAAMASAGTIDGGTATITSAGWGVAGFAIIGTTLSAPRVPRFTSYPQLLAH